MHQKQIIGEELSFLKMLESETGSSIPNEDKEPYITNEKILKDFLSNNDDEKNKEYIANYMLKIFNPIEDRTEDTFEENDSFIYLLNKEKKEENETSKKNTIKENANYGIDYIIPEREDFSISLNKNKETESLKFIAKKRAKSQDKESNYLDNQKTQTKDTSENIQKNNIVKIKERKQEFQYRLDYYKKAFKVSCFQHLTQYLNDLIPKCNFPKELKKKKLFKPNNESFTANAKEEDNYRFLSMPLKDAYCYVKNENNTKGISLQKSNKIFIAQLLKNIEEKGDNITKECETLRQYLNMNVEEYIKIYYETEDFKQFCEEDKIKFYEKEFIKEKKFGMFEKYGFLKLIKIYELNKNFSYGLKSIHS
jgi:hypothetical protein